MNHFSKLTFKLVSLLVVMLLSISLHAQIAVQPQGEGTAVSPYLISNWQELYWISQNNTSWSSYFLQTADIDLTLATPAISTWDSGGGWTPIGNSTTNFSGSYDAGGYVVNGVYCKRNTTNYQGLFGRSSASSVIKNLGVTSVNITGSLYVGSMIGYNLGQVSICFATGIVKGTNFTGGFVGYNIYSGNISNCFSRTNVIRSSGTLLAFGGFVGEVTYAIVNYCYSTGKVEYSGATAPTTKGFVGSVNTGGDFL
ncbi:MAG: hypothetical protein IPO21_00255 [Bacteroidales bacterium]|nr:hypothetical protein [Bacteroidales bacterium]